VIRKVLRVPKRSAVPQVSGYAGRRSVRLAAAGVGQSRLLGAALDHLKNVEPGHCIAGHLVALVHAPEKRPLLIASDVGSHGPSVEILLEHRTAWHLMALAALGVSTTSACGAGKIAEPHRHHRTHAGEA
jgi:hypothetical protein